MARPSIITDDLIVDFCSRTTLSAGADDLQTLKKLLRAGDLD